MDRDICVLKQLLAELVENEIAAVRFQREAHVSSLLVHPRIARVIDAGFEDKSFCIAMELIVGKDIESMMHALMRQHRLLPYPVSLTTICGVLEALAYAHDARDVDGTPMHVVHRDLSPRNMMLGYDGEAKVIDFGMAKGTFDEFKTRPGMVLGTLRYVSPEQAQALPVDARSDIYSVSVVLHELLTGRIMVPPDKPGEMLKRVVLDEPQPVQVLNPSLPEALSPVIAKGLAKDPKQRWATAAEYRAALLAAAPDLAATSPQLLGEFMREQFPEELAAAERYRILADTTPRESPHSKTRTLMASDLVPSRTPLVEPSALSESEVHLTTKTGLDFPMLPAGVHEPTVILFDQRSENVELGPSGTLVVRRSRPPSMSGSRDITRDREIARNAATKTVLITLLIVTALAAVGAAVFFATRAPVTAVVAPVPTPVAAGGRPAIGAQPGATPAATPTSTPEPPRKSAAPKPSPSPTATATPVKPAAAPVSRFAKLDALVLEAEAASTPRQGNYSDLLDALEDAVARVPESKRANLRAAAEALSGKEIMPIQRLVADIKAAAVPAN